MSQQGGRSTGHEDDWWGQLYDDSTEDTGPTPAADSLDDRFASAAGAVRSAGTAAGTGTAAGACAPVSGGDDDTHHADDSDQVDGVDDADLAGPVGSVPAPRAERPGPRGRTDWWARQGQGADTGTGTGTGWDPGDPGSGLADERDARHDAGRGTGRDVGRHAGRGVGWAADPNASSAAGQGADVDARGVEADPGTPPPERYRAPWEPPSATPPGPENFLPGPLPPGFDERAPHGPASSTPDGRTPTETPSAPSA
ncbi:hypothetical protein PV408_21860, partial [Streptomyces sp. ME18-1-4]|nr:hypothetical protein [Streptomyces sp. ME18-1-4]